MKIHIFQLFKRIAGAPLVAAMNVLGVLVLTACSPGGSEDVAPQRVPTRVPVASPNSAPGYSAHHVFSGRVEAARTATLGFEVGGQLAHVLVDEGQRVEADAVLASLDTDRLQAARREREAALLEAQSQLTLAEKTLQRVDEALAYRGVSRQQVDEARDARDRATAALAMAQARLHSIDVDLAKGELHAPFAGTVARRLLDEGAVVAPGTSVLVLEESAVLRARVGVSGDLARNLTAGDEQTLEGPTGSLAATVRAVLPVRNAVSRTVDVLFDLPTAQTRGLRPGDLVQLALDEYRQREGYWLPMASLTEGERGLWTALVVEAEAGASTPDYRVTQRIVEVVYHDGDRVFITNGIGERDLLVVDGTHRVVVGQRVTPSGPAVADSAIGEEANSP